MKTLLKASGIGSALAFMSAIGLVGCGADMGTEGASGEGAEIGSVEEAITASLPAARTQFDSCRLNVASTELILTAAGSSTIGGSGFTVQSDIRLASQPGNAFLTPDGTSTTSLPVARRNARLINDPASPNDTCYVVGGQNNAGTAVNGANDKAYKIVVSKPGAAFHIALSSITALTPRANLQVAACGDGGNNSLVAIGGEDGGASKNHIEVLTSGSSAFASVSTLGTARHNFGLALVNDGTRRNFVVTAGVNNSAGELDVIEALKFNTDCTSVTVTPFAGASVMSIPRGNTVAFEGDYDAVTERTTVIVPGGTNGTAQSSMETIVIDFTGTPTFVSSSSTASALQGTTANMALAFKGLDAYIIGGNSGSTARAFVSKFAYGGSSFASLTALSTARKGLAVSYLPTADKIQVIGGDNANSTVLSSAEEVTP